MTKYDYFKALEQLSECALRSVELSCGNGSTASKNELSVILSNSDKILLSLEKALFEDFLPPLERDGVAAYAHSLKEVTAAAGEHMSFSSLSKKKSEEEFLCLSLASLIKESTSVLRNLKKTSELPKASDFRALERKAYELYCSDVQKITSGSLPAMQSNRVFSTGRLRTTLSKAFDTLVEIMLDNI